jgi:hypothetical protein
MSRRLNWILAVPLVALSAAACTDDVTQQASGSFFRASFDPDRALIPTPNDLALQAAPSQPAGALRTTLFALIGAGGFPGGAPNQLNVINVPFEFVVDGVGTTATVGIDPATVNTTTVAIVRVSGAGAPELVDPTVVGTAAGAIQVFPATGYAAGERYVAAVRGGPNGVRTSDGRALAASSPMYLIARNVDLSDPDTRPSSVTPEQAADLQQLQGLLGNAVDWVAVASSTTCAAVLDAPPQAFPEDLCWLPFLPSLAGAPGVPAGPDSQPVRSALAAVTELAFPVSEAISIQAFEIQ